MIVSEDDNEVEACWETWRHLMTCQTYFHLLTRSNCFYVELLIKLNKIYFKFYRITPYECCGKCLFLRITRKEAWGTIFILHKVFSPGKFFVLPLFPIGLKTDLNKINGKNIYKWHPCVRFKFWQSKFDV